MSKDTIQNIFIGVLLAGLVLLISFVYLLAAKIETATKGIQRIERGLQQSQGASEPDAMALQGEESTTLNFGAINEMSVKTGAGTFTFTQVCKGEAKTVRGYKICVGMNRLMGLLDKDDGSMPVSFILDEREGKMLPAYDEGYDLYEAPSLLSAQIVPFDPSLYESGYLPSDVILSYETSPSVNGGEGVGSIAEPITHLILANGGNGTPSVRRLNAFPQYTPPSFGPVGKGVWIAGPVCSGAACTMEPEALQIYDLYTDSSTYVGREKATLEYATEDWNQPDKTYRIWGVTTWIDLQTLEAQIIEPDGSMTTFHVLAPG